MAASNGVCAEEARLSKIAELNDEFREGRGKGRLFVTPGIIHRAGEAADAVLSAVKAFKDFTVDNDPYGEHDFGSIEWDGELIFWKIDYYDIHLEGGSPDPADPAVTTRVLTIMLASEY